MPLPDYTTPTPQRRTYRPARRGGGGYAPGEYNPLRGRPEGTWNEAGTEEGAYFGGGSQGAAPMGFNNPWGARHRGNLGAGGGGAGGRGRGSMRALADLSLLDEDIDVPDAPTFEAPDVPVMSEQMTAAERAALTSTKERSGLRMQRGMKDLQGYAAEHGLTGSGRESGAMSALLAAGLGDMAETERGLLGSRTGRLRDLEDMDYRGRYGAAERNFSGAQEHNRLIVDAQRQRLETLRLLAQYGMGY